MTTTHFHPESVPVKVALVGYGNAGRIFHAPLISGVPGLQLHTIASSRPHDVLADWPQAKVVPTPEMAFADAAVQLVVIATGNESHYPLAKAALLAGKHVLVDKPCTVTLQQTEDLLSLAKERGLVLTVFQNRRWDADFLALRQVIDSGVLGRIVHFESHFDRYRSVVPDRWREQDLPGSGLWVDLGAHLADQCMQLFGAPDDLMVDTACQREGAIVNDYFHAQLRYPKRHPGLRVLLHGGALVPAIGPRFVVHGTLGSFVKYGLDVQEDALKAGARPRLGATESWGHDPLVGTLTVYADGQPVQSPAPDIAGNYLDYYAQLRDHLQGVAPAPAVTPEQVYQDMRVLGLGEISAKEGRFVAFQ
jgi:predicted dehydrogenase